MQVVRLDSVDVDVIWHDDRLRLQLRERCIVLPWTPSLLARARAWLRHCGVRMAAFDVEARLRAAIEAQTIARDPTCAMILRRVAAHRPCLLVCTSIVQSRPLFAQALRTSAAAVFVARLLDRECRSVAQARRRLRRWRDVFRDGSGAGVDAATVDRWSDAPTALWAWRAVRATLVPREFVALSLVARMVETVEAILGHDATRHPRRERPAVQFFALPRVRRAIDGLLRLDHAGIAVLWRTLLRTPVPRSAVLLEHLVARAFLVGLCRTAGEVQGDVAADDLVSVGLDDVVPEARARRIAAVAELPHDGVVADALRGWFAAATAPPPSVLQLNARGRPAPRPPPSRKVQAIASLWRVRQPTVSAQALREVQRDRHAQKVMARRRFWLLGLDRHLQLRAFRLVLSWYGSSTDLSRTSSSTCSSTGSGCGRRTTARRWRCGRRWRRWMRTSGPRISASCSG